MTTTHRVALLGFSDFERSTLASCFRLAPRRAPSYALAPTLEQAHFVVADADHAATVLEVTAAGRVDDTVFIGNRPPPGATAWMLRPIDPLHVMRELDAMVALQQMEAARLPPEPPPEPPPAAPAWRPAAAAPEVPGLPKVPDAPDPLSTPDARALPAPAAPPRPARRVVREPVLSPPLLLLPPLPPLADAAGPPQALLVDDSEIACAYLARRLREWGVQCSTAPDSTRALEMLSRRRFDLVFIDVELGPGSALDGLALCQRLRRRHPAYGADSPLLAMVSAHHRELDRARGTLAGADAYLGKPLDDDELAQALRRHGISPTSPSAR